MSTLRRQHPSDSRRSPIMRSFVSSRQKTACGNNVETLTEAVNNDASPHIEAGMDDIEDTDMTQGDESDVVFSKQSSNNISQTSSGSRKRHRNNNGDALIEAMQAGFEGIQREFKDASMEHVAQVRRVAHKANMVEKKQQLREEVSKVPGFTGEQLTKVTLMIGNDEIMLLIFPTLPPHVKAMVVRGYNK